MVPSSSCRVRVRGIGVVAVVGFGFAGVLLAGGSSGFFRAAEQPADAHPVIPLWPDGAPGAKGTDPDKDVPTLTLWLPSAETATGAAVVVCPGGGSRGLAVEHEGKQ